ncbi:DNA repair protein RadC [Desulfosporosinus sp. I2]|uniref:JAB domain-containing protein n=1 Tax=Desulfosporosinus sp. I2 TaxID=1617025 RepID=UPI00061F5429|nr:JAB domain-containing protein [Desulfosporosinus sp. I2]KJR47371.1 DNA repair protein RadC [Desulfosporosinus sp. I2]
MNPLHNQVLENHFLNGLAGLTGLSHARLKEYSDSNSFFNILDHPQLINPTPRQLEKIELIKELIKSYNVLRTLEKETKVVFNNPYDAGKYFVALLEGKRDKEVFMVTFLDTKFKIIETKIFSEGTVNQAPIYPREILKRALDCSCKAIMLAHNHPSGDTTPSREDIGVTQNMVNIFDPLGIEIVDHIIVGGVNYYSLRENNDFTSEVTNTPNYTPVHIKDFELEF